MSTVRQLAADLASDIESSPQSVEFTGIELLPILIPLITRLFECGKDNDNITPETASARVRQLHERDPARLRKRVAKNAMRKNKELTKQQAVAIADATIAKAIATPEDVVSAACSEVFVGNGESDELIID